MKQIINGYLWIEEGKCCVCEIKLSCSQLTKTKWHLPFRSHECYNHNQFSCSLLLFVSAWNEKNIWIWCASAFCSISMPFYGIRSLLYTIWKLFALVTLISHSLTQGARNAYLYCNMYVSRSVGTNHITLWNEKRKIETAHMK